MNEKLKDIEIVIADIDGTMTPVGGATVSQRVKQAIVDARRSGVHFTLASGRGFAASSQIYQELELDTLAIIAAGTEIVQTQTGEVTWGLKLSEEQIRNTVEVLAPYNPRVLLASESLQQATQLSDRTIPGEQQTLYVIGLDHAEAQQMVRDADVLDDVSAHTTPSWQGDKLDVHFTHKEAHKGTTVTELLSMHGIDMSKAAAIGDSGNDIPLLDAVGLKVAMGNATEELKEVADIVVDTVENDGVAQFIEMIVEAKASSKT